MKTPNNKKISAALRASLRYPLHLASLFSLVWVGFLWWIVADLSPRAALNRFHHLRSMEPNEIGDFLAGAFAPIAAIWLVATVVLQFSANRSTQLQFEHSVARENQKDRNERQRRETAARLRLPYALLELSDYWEACFQKWRNSERVIPTPPREAMRELIEIAADIPEPTFESLQKLISTTQVFLARMTTLAAQPDGRGQSLWLHIMIADLMRLYYLTNRLFPYGRFEEPAVPYTEPTRYELSALLQNVSRRDESVLSSSVSDRFEAALPDE